MRCLVLGLAFLLAACGSSESPAPAAKPPISPEVAAAPDRLYHDGRVLPADRWEQDGEVLFYEWQGQRQMLLRTSVVRIEGTPRPREVIVGSAQTQSTLGRSGAGRSRIDTCGMPWVGEPESRIDDWLRCLGSEFTRRQYVTATTAGATTQHVITYLGSTVLYLYTSNSRITAVQNAH